MVYITLLKTYLNMGKDDLQSVGWNMYYKSMSKKIEDKIDAFSFTNLSSDEVIMQGECKGMIRMMVPLCMELSSSDF